MTSGTTRGWQRTCAVGVTLLGIIGIASWVVHPAAAPSLVGLVSKMGLNTPLMFVAAGVALFLSGDSSRQTRPWRILRLGCIALLALFAAVLAFESFVGVNLGIDFVRTPTLPTPDVPNPGRPAPNTCICFMLAAANLFLASRTQLSATQRLTRSLCEWAIYAIALTAVAGYLLDLAPLYRIATFNMMLPVTAAGLCLLAVGLSLTSVTGHRGLPDNVSEYKRRINVRVAAILLAVTSCAGVAGFALMRDGLEQSVLDNTLLTATTSATSLANTLEGKLWFPRAIVTHPAVVDSVEILVRNPGDRAT
ncbi:MAG: hypothetical protein WKG03_06810, partial [Telluria sp.]